MIFTGFIVILDYDEIADTSGVTASSVLYVGGFGPGNYSTIQAAIDNASAGDIIYVWDGEYIENITITKTITLIGNGTASTIINGNGTDDVVTITASWTNITGFKINGSGNINTDAGIRVNSANYVHINNINCSNNRYGMLFYNSDYCMINNNNVSSNYFNGIALHYSENNTVENNFNHYNGYSAIELLHSHTNLVFDNNCCYNENGVELGFSDFNELFNNSFNYNWWTGFCIWDSDRNIINDNNASYNFEGLYLSYWYYNGPKFNMITNNTANRNDYSGIDLEYAVDNLVENNTCNFNEEGIISYDKNIIINNICNFNDYGIITYDDYPMEIKYNICNYNNYDGIAIYSGYLIDIVNNTCNYNDVGISVWANNNNFTRNTCNSNNQYGIFISRADWNSFKFNNISNNPIGIRLENNNGYNIFLENEISYNTNVGFSIESGSFDNDIYHNFFISNSKQAEDNANNNWDYKHEGNYWDDYTGLDNGANDRVAGDGIGDTQIPHPGPGLDNYPFMRPYDWIYPARPGLILKSDFDPDGNYIVSWYDSARATGYVIEEDDNIGFNSPSEYTEGWVVQIDMNVLAISGKSEGTYYYRAKAYNDIAESDWSEIVNVTVDLPPMVPQNLTVSVIPEGNSLHITWDLNTGDTVKYGLHFKNGTKWELLSNVTHPGNSYMHLGLVDGKEYYYKICAIDILGQVSDFSDIITGIPKDSIPPSAPTGLNAKALSKSEIAINWDANTDYDLAGYDIYLMSSLDDPMDDFELRCKIMGRNTSYIVTDLMEEVTYQFKLKAFDEAPNNSTFSNIASATTPDETPPNAPTHLRVFNATVNSLTLSWEYDPLSDVVGFFINRSLNSSGPYEHINTVPIRNNLFIDTDLAEETTYYYKLRAIDEVNLSSQYSDYAFGTTLQGQKEPRINNSLKDFSIEEDSYDDSSINLYTCFIDENNDKLTFRCDGQKLIDVTIFQENGSVVLKPEPDWNGVETLTFYANDSMFEISESVKITVTSINDPPDKPTIIKPENGTMINEGELLDFIGICTDPDLLYGDTLAYKWVSTIDSDLGINANITDVLLSAGNHTIILIVTDDSGLKSMTTVDIIVNAKSTRPSTEEDGLFSNILMWTIIIIVLIVAVIIIFIFQRKKKLKKISWVEDMVDLETRSEKKITDTSKKPSMEGSATPTKDLAVTEHVEAPQRELCSRCGLEMVFDEDIETYQCKYCDVWEEE